MSAALASDLRAAPVEAPAQRPRLPAEYLGRARQFRQRLIASSTVCTATLDRITGKTLRRYNRTPIPRPGALTDLARAWRYDLPEYGRLDLQIEPG